MRIITFAFFFSVCCYSQVVSSPPINTTSTLSPNMPISNTSNNDYTYCTDPRSQVCYTLYMPVCGFKAMGEPQTYGNQCNACSVQDVIAWLPEACFNQVVTCLSNVINCSLIRLAYVPSCGLAPGKAFQDAPNAVCCQGNPYTQVIAHKCPVLPVTPPPPANIDYIYCPDGPKQTICTLEYIATCGFPTKGLPQDYANTCTACADENVFAYKIGSCSNLLKTCSANRLDCRLIRAPFVQSCGFEDNKAPYNVSNNLCCSNSTYSQVIIGVCPKIPNPSNVTICSSKRTTICYYIYLPVCGKYKNGTTMTFSNDCVACSYRSVVSHTPGACP